MAVLVIWVTLPGLRFLQIPKKVGFNYKYNPLLFRWVFINVVFNTSDIPQMYGVV